MLFATLRNWSKSKFDYLDSLLNGQFELEIKENSIIFKIKIDFTIINIKQHKRIIKLIRMVIKTKETNFNMVRPI